MTDLELCQKKDYYGIFERYKMLYYKIWDTLSPALKFNVWTEEADFFSFCYEKTVMAVDSIKPDKVKHPETWTIYIQLYRYISTYARRAIEKEYRENMQSLDAFIEEKGYDENAALKTEDYQEVDMSIFSDEEKELIDFLQSGHKWKEKYTQHTFYKLKKSIISKLLD